MWSIWPSLSARNVARRSGLTASRMAVVIVLASPPSMRVSWMCRGRYSAGSRANRAAAATAGRGGGEAFSVAFSSIEAILVTLTTSSSSARAQAVSTGPGP